MGEVLPLWLIAGLLGAFLVACIASGRIPGRGRSGILDRRRNPAVFWSLIGLLSVTFAAMAVTALLASLT